MAILTTTNQGLNFIGGTTFIQTGTSTVMSLQTNGNVGIGVISPGDKLSIEDSGSVRMSIYSTDTGSQSVPKTFIDLYGENTAAEKRKQASIASAPGHNASNAGELQFFTNDSSQVSQQRMTIREDGTVGIGIANPTTPLHLIGIAQIVTGSDTAFYEGASVRMFGSQSYTFRNSPGQTRAIINVETSGVNAGNLSLYNASTILTTKLNNAGDSYFNGGNVGIGTTSPAAKLDVVGNIKSPTNSLSTTAAPTSFGVYTSEVRLIDTPNGGLKKCRVITDVYGEWILVGRFAASAMNTIANAATWSSVSGMTTGTAQNETTQFSADFGDSFPEEVRIMGATDFTSWRDTRTVDFVYKVPEGRKWKFFFSGGVENGMVQSTKFGWNINGAYDGFGRWVNTAQNFVRMSDGQVNNPSAAYTTATANAFAWDTADDAKITVSATRVFSGQDTFETAGFGNDDNIYGFFDEYPNETSNMQGGVDFSSAAWVLIKLPEGASGSGGSGTNYWAADGNDIYNTNSANVGIGTDSPTSPLTIKSNSTSSSSSGLTIQSSGNTNDIFQLGEKSTDGARLQMLDAGVVKIALYSDGSNNYINAGNVGIGVTGPEYNLDVSGSTRVYGFLNTSNYMEKLLPTLSFPNSVANQNIDIKFGNISFWGYIEVEITGTYSNQNSSGKLTKVYAVGTNPSVIYTNESRVSDSLGEIKNNIALGDFRYDSTTGSETFAIKVSHIVATGNGYTVKVRVFTHGSSSVNVGARAAFANLTIGSRYTETALTKNYVNYNDSVAIGTSTPMANTIYNGTYNQGLNIDKGGHSSLLIGDGVNDGGMIQSSDSSQRIIITANVYDQPNASWQRFTADSAALIDVYGQGSGAFISFNVDNGTSGFPTNRMHIKNNGNVGIGTTGPNDILHVSKTGAATRLRVGNNGAHDASIYFNTSTDWSIGTDTSNSNALTFGNSSGIGTNTKMVIETGGDVGIGITGPTAKLQVAGETFVKTSNGVSDLYLGNHGTPNLVSNRFARFHTNNSDTYFDMNCGVVYWRQINATRFQNNMNNGTLTASGDVIAYGAPSDIRLKENIKPIESALDKVMKLEGVTFDWKESDSILDIKEDIGFIAQDVQKIVPELVRENEDGMLSMRHQGIAPILLEAIKELKAEIEELKKQIK